MEKKIGIIGYGSMGKMLLEKIVESEITKQSHIYCFRYGNIIKRPV
ncbi:MAG: NAD(P)-binding domain-containing protein [Treponema sp.]|nr:NAD(P)-binding domain-containing protein [Treponema sp.]